MSEESSDRVAVIGAGLVGSMVACFLARRGLKVDLYEMRPDIRKQEHVVGKSINLALSDRGRAALRALNLEDQIIKNYAIAMRARLIHDLDGKRRPIPYGKSNQAIYSVSRRLLNELLISTAEKEPNVRLFFDAKLTGADFNSMTLRFDNNNGQQNGLKYAQIIGCDGAYSMVRRSMMKATRLNYEQQYIDHGYIELTIPPDPKTGEHRMELNYLHIWARGTFMLIALPNQDGSYTVTLFMPFEWFANINSKAKLIDFFSEHFPDAIELIGESKLIEDYFSTSPSPLISVKCSPLNLDSQALLIGDAAHAMVPFFGQGMNCGFEDCLILDELLQELLQTKSDEGSNISALLGEAFPLFTARRNEDCHVICDLAMYNYIEMRHLVNSFAFIIRKKVDLVLNTLLPGTWVPLYGMVTFSRTPYSKVVQLRKRQDRILFWAYSSLAALAGVVMPLGAYWTYKLF